MMNDYKNDSRAPDRTEADDDALLSLLRSAYPAPPPGMADRIMAKIREEGAGDEKILPASRKKGLRRALVRWGALAACVVLVGSVGLKVLPVFTRDMAQKSASTADSAMPEEVFDEAVEEALDGAAEAPAEPESAADMPAQERSAVTEAPYGGGAAKSSADSAEAVPEMEEAYDDAAPMAPAAENSVEAPAAPAPEPEAMRSAYTGEASEEWGYFDTDAADEYGAAEEAVEDGLLSIKLFTLNGVTGLHALSAGEGEIPMMAGAPVNEAQDSREMKALDYYYVRTACAHADTFRNSYHDIPDVLIARVGPQLYGAWATKVQNEDLCGVNILSFALRFNLTAEDIYGTGDTWYFLDLPEDIPLTEENAGAVEQYYLNGGDPGKMVPRVTIYELKTAMIREAGLSAYAAWRGDREKNLVSWTVREGAEALGLDGETMNRLYEEAAEKVAAEYGGEYMPAREEVFAG